MSAAALAAALVLDAAFGEPAWLWSRLPHPVVVMGRAIDGTDRHLNRGRWRRIKGAVALAALIVIAALIGIFLEALPLAPLWQALIAAVLLAQRSLVGHVADVAAALRQSTREGRRSVGLIVGRDTAQMTEAAVSRAALESAAENLSDAVIAPVFWFLVAGLPGILVYKLVNTADSMIGHRTPRHEAFGWAAARTDDLLNLVPARLSAALIWAVSLRSGAWAVILRDAPLHRSPNAGWPEAAMATALDVALSGPRSYGGEMRDFPFVNADGRREIGPAEVDHAVRLLWRVWSLTLGLTLAMALL